MKARPQGQWNGRSLVSMRLCQPTKRPFRLDFAMIATYACEHGAADVQGVQRIFHSVDNFLYLAFSGLMKMRHNENMTGESSLVVPNKFADPSQISDIEEVHVVRSV